MGVLLVPAMKRTPAGSSKEDIKAAYRQAALKCHPDVDKSPEAMLWPETLIFCSKKSDLPCFLDVFAMKRVGSQAPQRFLRVREAYQSLMRGSTQRPSARRLRIDLDFAQGLIARPEPVEAGRLLAPVLQIAVAQHCSKASLFYAFVDLSWACLARRCVYRACSKRSCPHVTGPQSHHMTSVLDTVPPIYISYVQNASGTLHMQSMYIIHDLIVE